MFSRMAVFCPICRIEMDGMRGYGRTANCCDKECYDEWEWRKTLAILGKQYAPRENREQIGKPPERSEP